MDANMFTTPFQLTKSMHRDVYPAVDPSNPTLSAKNKVIIITGAGEGLGAVSPIPQFLIINQTLFQAQITILGDRKSLGSGWCCRPRPHWAFSRNSQSHRRQRYQDQQINSDHRRAY